MIFFLRPEGEGIHCYGQRAFDFGQSSVLEHLIYWRRGVNGLHIYGQQHFGDTGTLRFPRNSDRNQSGERNGT